MNLSLAPIQGMTLAYYRNIFSDIFGGIDTYYTPFISTTQIRKLTPVIFKDILPEANYNHLRIIPQLLGNNGEDFRYYAKKIVDMGYKEINWNIGCPYHTVTKKKKGSGILPHPDMIKTLLDEVCKDNTYDLNIKLRLGLNHLDEGMKVIELLNDYPLSGVIIHARTGSQKYEGHVDLDAFEVLYNACKHEMTYNGDIFTVDDYNRIQSRFPRIENFMLGRGALQDPFLPSAIKGNIVPTSEKIEKITEFHNHSFEHFKTILSGDRHLADKMKEFWTYTSVHLDPSGKFMKKIKKCHSSAAYLEIVKQMLTSSTWQEDI